MKRTSRSRTHQLTHKLAKSHKRVDEDGIASPFWSRRNTIFMGSVLLCGRRTPCVPSIAEEQRHHLRSRFSRFTEIKLPCSRVVRYGSCPSTYADRSPYDTTNERQIGQLPPRHRCSNIGIASGATSPQGLLFEFTPCPHMQNSVARGLACWGGLGTGGNLVTMLKADVTKNIAILQETPENPEMHLSQARSIQRRQS